MENYYILKSTNIFTGTQAEVLNGYVVIKNNTIEGVYKFDELPESIKHEATLIDYEDHTISPGFIEAHSHVQLSALIFNGLIQNIDGESEIECVHQLIKKSSKANLINGWLVAKGWYLPTWNNRQLPTKASLDAVFPSYPVMLISDDLHTIWLNSIGIKLLSSILENKPEDVVKQSNKISGVVQERTAMACINHVLDMPIQERAEIYSTYLNYIASQGYTSICDLALLPETDSVDCNDQIYLDVYQFLEKKKQLPLRIFLFPYFDSKGERVKKLRNKLSSSLVSISGGKQFFDGVISSHTAWLKENYEKKNHAGSPVIAPEKLQHMINLAQKEEIPLRIHCIGNKACGIAIQYFIDAQKAQGPMENGYHTLEHLERIDKEDILLLKQAHLVASVQPSHPLMDYRKASDYLGERSQYMWPIKDMVKQGIPIAFGSDSPVVQDLGPFDNFYYALTRQTKMGEPTGGWQPEQRLDFYESILSHTKNASKACSAESQIGTLEAGKKADLVVIEGDLLTCPINNLPQKNVLETIVNGQTNYKMKEGINYVK